MADISKSALIQFSFGFLLLLSFLLLSSWTGAQKNRSIIIGMPYHEARKIILQSGWEPAQIERSDLDVKYRLPHFYYDAAYTEVLACSGTGMGYCSFKFQNAKEEYLRVTTQGGDYSPDDEYPPIVIYVGLSDDFDQ